MNKIPVYFNNLQLHHKPLYEWAFGERITHPETTRRAESILAAVNESGQCELHVPDPIGSSILAKVHDPRLERVFRSAEKLEDEITFYPSVFPKRHQAKGNPEELSQSGYFCFDSGTPLTNTTWEAAMWSAASALAAAKHLCKNNDPFVYSLSRPPGHHASRDLFGGYSYFNNAAIAAKFLRQKGRVAVLDIDFHHGNGTQSIFYKDPKVLVLSIHGDPREFYPYFAGYAEETGLGAGQGFNVNLPIPKGCDGQEYLKILTQHALKLIQSFDPQSLVVSAGFDTYKSDPIGRFTLETEDFYRIGEEIAGLKLPTLVVQEGGYCTEMLGKNVMNLLLGMRSNSTNS